MKSVPLERQTDGKEAALLGRVNIFDWAALSLRNHEADDEDQHGNRNCRDLLGRPGQVPERHETRRRAGAGT